MIITMKNQVIKVFLVISLLLAPQAYAQNSSNEKNLVKMGASQVNITPLVPTVMGGYGFRTTPFTGVHDELFASAFYFTSERTQSLIITADLLGFQTAFIDDLKRELLLKHGIKTENIMITAVHNHGGPGTRGYETDTMHTVEAYLVFLKEKLLKLSADAISNTEPVRMGIGKGYCNLNINRRAVFADGSVGLGRNPDGPCDKELTIARFEASNGKLMAVIVNWPCHGTASGPGNYQITGDWPGAAARYIKSQAGKDVIVGITAGASGDINPLYGPGNSFKEIEAVGYHVGKAAVKTLSDIVTFPVKELNATSAILTFPGKKPCKDELPHATYETGPDTEVRLTMLKIGDLVFAGISGEVMTEIGMEIKRLSPYSGTVVVTHCNGTSGYICTDKAFSEGGYEVSVTKIMPGAEKPLISKNIELIHSF